MRKTQILMNKPFYLVLSVLKLSKTVMHEFWYHYVKPKYGKNAKFCYIVTDSLCLCKKTKDVYKDVVEDVEVRFDTSNSELNRQLPKRKNKKVIGLIKDGLGG